MCPKTVRSSAQCDTKLLCGLWCKVISRSYPAVESIPADCLIGALSCFISRGESSELGFIQVQWGADRHHAL